MDLDAIIANSMRKVSGGMPAATKRTTARVEIRRRKGGVEQGRSNGSVSGRATFEVADPEYVDIEVEGVTVYALARFECVDIKHTTHPSKRSVKQAMSTRKMLPANRVFRGIPGGGRNAYEAMLAQIHAAETGCIVVENKPVKPMKSTTARGDGNLVGGYQYLR